MVGGFGAGIAGGATVAIVIKAVDQFSKTLTKAQKQMAAVGAAMVVVGTIGVLAMNKAVQSSSNLQESVNALNVVFGKSAKEMLKLSDTATKSFGLSKRAFNEGAVRFSAFAKIIANDGGDVVSVIKEITGRTADFASVMNIDLNRAQILIQAGLAGETEGLRRFGIDVSAATTKAFAFANGVGNGSRELTEQEKILARYGLILEQTEKFVGDFVNTSDDLANSQRILAAEFENAKAEIGEGLLPVMETLVNVLRTAVGWFSSLNDTTKQAIGIIIIVTSVVLILTGAVIALTIAVIALDVALLPFILTIGAIILAVTAVILLILNWKKVLFELFKLEALGVNLFKIAMLGLKNVVVSVWNFIVSFIEKGVNRIIDLVNFIIRQVQRIPGIEKIFPGLKELERANFSSIKGEIIDLGKAWEGMRFEANLRANILEQELGLTKEITNEVEKQEKVMEKISKEQELVNKLAGFKVLAFGSKGNEVFSDIFNPGSFQKKDFQSSFNFEQAKRGSGITINIENISGLDPEEISRALSDELNSKLSL